MKPRTWLLLASVALVLYMIWNRTRSGSVVIVAGNVIDPMDVIDPLTGLSPRMIAEGRSPGYVPVMPMPPSGKYMPTNVQCFRAPCPESDLRPGGPVVWDFGSGGPAPQTEP